ncbi:hypothetical protein FRC16_001498 [Serendipita sp. 398]|nr:hypothetical protein FRC16_001498 [Serendipita sp. 398]
MSSTNENLQEEGSSGAKPPFTSGEATCTSDYMSNGVGDSQYWDWKNLGNNIRGVAEEFANFMPVDMDFGLPAFQLYDTPIKRRWE